MNEKERPLEPEYGKNCYEVKTENYQNITYVVYANSEEEARRAVENGYYDDIDDEDSVKEIVSICEII